MCRSYKDAISALNSLQSNHATIEALKNSPVSPKARSELSISEVYEYTRRLGYSPSDLSKLNVIHVTGTKGKGSTCAFTESILLKHQCQSPSKIGLFTSPHLISVRERIRINGSPISEQLFAKYFFEVWDKLSATQSPAEFPTLQPSHLVKPMYFKYLTILSFHVFMSEGVDTAIYEVGVGGRYDSTNIVEKPTVTAVTSLGIDHTFMLGDTIDSIAWNKAGIYKKNVPALLAQQKEHPETEPMVEKLAEEQGASSFEVVDPEKVLPKNVSLGLAGHFQRQNAAMAVEIAALHLRKLGFSPQELPQNGSLPPKFLQGLADARWDGRCQLIQDKKYPGVSWFLDGAHTKESIDVATQWFNESTQQPKKVLIFNQQSRENASELLARLQGKLTHKFDHVIFTTNITWAHGTYNADLVSMNNSQEAIDKLAVQRELAETYRQLDDAESHVFASIQDSMRFVGTLGPADVFVCGSLHLVGGLLAVLQG